MRRMFGTPILSAVCLPFMLCGMAQSATVDFAISLDGTQAGTGSAATGSGTAMLDTQTNLLIWNVTFDRTALVNGASSVTAAHFHVGAPGVNGAPINPPGGVATPATGPLVGAAVITDAAKVNMLSGAVYFNIHTTPFPNGEIRGQLVPAKVTLAAKKDNTLYESATGSTSNGAGTYLFVGRSLDNHLKRALVVFDLAAAGMPPGSTITEAAITLSVSKTQSGISAVTFYRLLRDWGEGTSNASDNEGKGAAATIGDATWLHTSFNTSFWSKPGGDSAPASSATQSVGGLGKYTWGSTDQMVSDVQVWLDKPTSNFGWLVLGDESASPPTAKRFNSRENAVDQPVLTMRYKPPCLFALAGDVNGDCRVDFLDFAVTASNWLTDCDSLPLDPACIPK